MPHVYSRRELLKILGAGGATLAGFTSVMAAQAVTENRQHLEQTLNGLVRKYSAQQIFFLNVGESRRITLRSGATHEIRLVSLKEHRDSVIYQPRRDEVGVEIDGRPLELICEPYRMPTEAAGMRLQADTTSAWLKMPGQVQFSAWDAAAPIVDTLRFNFPLKDYLLFSQGTQAFNEVVHLGRGDGDPAGQKFLHNYGMDMAGYEGADRVLSATAGEVVMFWPSREKVSSIVVQDRGGILWEYAHLKEARPEIQLGVQVRPAQPLGLLGRTGASGAFSHLHLGTYLGDYHTPADVEGKAMNRHLNLYPWLVAAWRAGQPGRLCAVARPHCTVLTGEPVLLDGSRSLADGSKIVDWRWKRHDGNEIPGVGTTLTYDQPGTYIETLRVKDDRGREDVDFCTVRVFSRAQPEDRLPTIFMSCTPTERIRPGQPVRFRLWPQGRITAPIRIDFGDGVTHDGVPALTEVTHAFQSPGIHIVGAQSESDDRPIMQKIKVIVP